MTVTHTSTDRAATRRPGHARRLRALRGEQRVLIALMDHENYIGPAVDDAETQLLDVEDAITTLIRNAR